MTQQAYQRVTGKNPSMYRGLRLPVNQVGWDDAKVYCEPMATNFRKTQWEFAARVATRNRATDRSEIAWFDTNGGDQSHEVAQARPNAYRLYGMLGNMWE